MIRFILAVFLSLILTTSGFSSNFQNISALTPVADLTGQWSGFAQLANVEGTCEFSGKVNANIKQDGNTLVGGYSFVTTNVKTNDPDNMGFECQDFDYQENFRGTLYGSRIILNSDGGGVFTGWYASSGIKLDLQSSELVGTAQLSPTNFIPPAFEQEKTTPKPTPTPAPKPTPTPIPEPVPEDKSVSNQGTESVDDELAKTLEQLENKLEQNDWAEEAVLDTDKDGISDDDDSCPTQSETYNNYQDDDGCPDSSAPEIIIPTRIPDNFFKVNGCGSQGKGGVDVPDFDFAESCNQHDICYARGGDAEDRKICDEQMYESVKSNSVLGKFGATIYYWGVRLGGSSSFNCTGDSC